MVCQLEWQRLQQQQSEQRLCCCARFVLSCILRNVDIKKGFRVSIPLSIEDKKLHVGGYLMNKDITKEKELYFELYELYKNRLKTKHLTLEAFRFERESASQLAWAAHNIANGKWEVNGYFPFNVYHPNRVINAPFYQDRIVEQWFVEKYIQPVFKPKLHEYNMACQSGKGPFLAMDYVKAAMEEMYYMYGDQWYVFQYDIEGYFDNISHKAAKKIMKRIGKEGYAIYEKIVDSFCIRDGYAALEDPENPDGYGYPKGTLPSQWTGIILLDALNWQIQDAPGCVFNISYMDDGLAFFQEIEQCRKCREDTEQFLIKNELGIRLHPRKTYYAPISRGFTFCGWRYTIDHDGMIHVRIKNSKKKEMENRLKAISESVKIGKMSVSKANTIRDGMFEYLSHGTVADSNKLIRYMKHQYPIPTVKREEKYKRRKIL